MSDLEAIQAALGRTATRRRVARALRGLWAGLFCGAMACLLAIISYKLFPFPVQLLMWAAILPFAGALAGAVVGGWRRISAREAARWMDQQAKLQERLSTAIEMAPARQESTWAGLVLKDAAAHLKGLHPRQMLPFKLTGAAKLAALTLLLCAGLGLVPEHRTETHKRREADAENIQETGRRISEFAKRSLEKRPAAAEQARIAMETAGDLGSGLEKKDLTRTDAMREIATAAEKVRAQANELSKDPALKQMRQAARASGGEMPSKESLEKQIEGLKSKLGTESSPEQIDKLKSQLAKAEQRARALNSENSSASDRQQLGNELNDLARQAQALGIDLPQLDEAIEALAANQTGLLLKNLEASLMDLEKLSQMAKTLQALRQQADKLGKDLAEQLEKGQAERARETLAKLARDVQKAGISPDELNKIMEEVGKAIPPAGNYGKVAEHLEAARQQMKAGKNAEAAQSLQAAAKELENLMQQFADAEMMMATLEALNQASMCVGSGKCWGPGKKPGYGKGGKPGSGVGMWGDDSQEWDGAETEMADNSGVERPNSDPRSGAGEREASDPLSPSKVRGQFSPGGQMPSISLKGVGIKGQSSVHYEQAAEAAQSEAQSALSQDKVPRAYRDAVRNYFDEIKE